MKKPIRTVTKKVTSIDGTEYELLFSVFEKSVKIDGNDGYQTLESENVRLNKNETPDEKIEKICKEFSEMNLLEN